MQKRFTPEKADLLNRQEVRSELSEVAGESLRVGEPRFGERAEVPTALAAQVAMFDQVVFDIPKRWGILQGGGKILSQLRIRHQPKLKIASYRLSSRMRLSASESVSCQLNRQGALFSILRKSN